YAIPRLGRRIDVVLIINHVVFVLEFKVGECAFPTHAVDQVWDYALDLKNFHETSHRPPIAPILIATAAPHANPRAVQTPQNDNLFWPIESNVDTLSDAIRSVLALAHGPLIEPACWEQGRYYPTPTIIEAATSLYNGHSVADISRSDAGAINLTQ